MKRIVNYLQGISYQEGIHIKRNTLGLRERTLGRSEVGRAAASLGWDSASLEQLELFQVAGTPARTGNLEASCWGVIGPVLADREPGAGTGLPDTPPCRQLRYSRSVLVGGQGMSSCD